ncbi:hypothetical protein CYY_007232 [Polysphondylium violaceum]|uniref:Peptidyl-prolyl cis-trans isomerase n=1 Tax=Polysphondylium violaceum TaxID=133409 RepID=A0A8J4UY54_9MYCE|nr:hypothetical protein CYY_007232 [Polysphondylium violaceum]
MSDKEDNNQDSIVDDENEVIPPFKAPDWASLPISNVYLEVVKNDVNIDKIDISKEKFTVFGRNSDVASVLLDHPSVSRRHAALVYHGVNDRFYLIDLHSARGTFINNQKIKPNTPSSVKEGHIITFGSSSKKFVLRGVVPRQSSSSSGAKANEPKQVKCRHLLVKHRGSRNPHSWREDNITKTKEQAIAILLDYREKISSGQYKFEELAQKYSDCGSAKKGGMLDPFTRGKMQKPFEDASFALEVGQLSSVVDTDSGVHIIERMA